MSRDKIALKFNLLDKTIDKMHFEDKVIWGFYDSMGLDVNYYFGKIASITAKSHIDAENITIFSLADQDKIKLLKLLVDSTSELLKQSQ